MKNIGECLDRYLKCCRFLLHLYLILIAGSKLSSSQRSTQLCSLKGFTQLIHITVREIPTVYRESSKCLRGNYHESFRFITIRLRQSLKRLCLKSGKNDQSVSSELLSQSWKNFYTVTKPSRKFPNLVHIAPLAGHYAKKMGARTTFLFYFSLFFLQSRLPPSRSFLIGLGRFRFPGIEN